MTIGQALSTKLRATSALTAIVGQKIYPFPAPNGTKTPFVTTQKISDPQTHTLNTDDGPYQPMYQIVSWGGTIEEAYSAADQVKTALKDYSGTMGGEGGMTVQRVLFEDEIELPNTEPGNYYGVAQEYIIWHE